MSKVTSICVAPRGAVSFVRHLARPLEGRTFLHVNSTKEGGGVAEILNRLLPLLEEVGVETRWEVITGPPEFYAATKRIHNTLQGAQLPFTETMREAHREAREALRRLVEEDTAGDREYLKAVEAFEDVEREIRRRQEQLREREDAILTPRQRAQRILFEPRFHEQMRQRMQRAQRPQQDRRPAMRRQLEQLRETDPELYEAIRRRIDEGEPLTEEQIRARLVDLLDLLVQIRSRETGVARNILANRADLDRVIGIHWGEDGGARTPAILTGWRAELVGQDLGKLLDGQIVLGVDPKGRVPQVSTSPPGA